MKKLITLLFLLVCMVSLALAQKKIALIVAIGDYPTGGSWGDLSSLNDMRYVKQALMKNGFKETDIDTLLDTKATKAGIVKALDDLYAKAGKDDIVYFHYSGHGQQIQDDNGDETDGYDEALIAYDADGVYDPVGYTGQNHLRDDLLGEKLTNIRKKIGAKGSLLVLVDACHSGTTTRSAGIKRGTETPFQQGGYKPKIKLDLGGAAQAEQGFFGAIKEGMGNMIAISACSPNQINKETQDANHQGVGSLSYAFARAITELPAGSNYYTMFEKVKAYVQGDIPTQIPMIEGNEELEVFGGNYIPKKEIITVQQKYNNAANKFNDTSFVINMGQVNSVYEGTTLTIYKQGSQEVYANARVADASAFQSICFADKKLKKEEVYEAKLATMNYGDFSAVITMQTTGTPTSNVTALQEQIKVFVKPYQYLSLGKNGDFALNIKATNENGYTVMLIDKADSLRYNKTFGKDVVFGDEEWKDLLGEIKLAMRMKYLRKMTDGGTLAKNVKVEIKPGKPSTDPNEIILKPKEDFTLTITNKGRDDFYYTVIDMTPDNKIQVLIPYGDKSAADFSLKPGMSAPFPATVDDITPNGKEMFKVIISTVPMDLRSVFNRTRSKGNEKKGAFEQVIDDIFKDSNDGRATRGNVGSLKVDETGIVTVGFTVKN